MATTPDVLRLQHQCWERAVHCFGTAAIFERRAERWAHYTGVLTFLGIVGPLVVGGAALSFGVGGRWIGPLLILASVVGLMQLVLSVWSLTAGWRTSLAYARESAADNHRLAEEFQKLAKSTPKDFAVRYDLIDNSYSYRSMSDVKQDVTFEEKRYGLRCGLHRFQRSCVECQLIPKPDAPSSCSVCGK